MAKPEELSGELWPIHLKPLEDELLSCWMVRLARAYGVKPVWFWNRVWQRGRIAFRYIDRIAPVDLLMLLSEATATGYERVVQTTLQPLAEIRSIPAAFADLRYCPECLAADVIPYFRRQWQMGFLLVCLVHGRHLQAACPRCRVPLAPELLPPDTDSVAGCGHCRANLRMAQPDTAPIPKQVLDWERRLWRIVAAERPCAGAAAAL